MSDVVSSLDSKDDLDAAHHWEENLQRLIDEIEVLEHVYGCTEDNKHEDIEANGVGPRDADTDMLSRFVLLSSVEELNEAKEILRFQNGLEGKGKDASAIIYPKLSARTIPTIRIEIQTTTHEPSPITATLQVCLPCGYPTHNCAQVSYVKVQSTPQLTRSSVDSVTARLTERAQSEELHGVEAVMDLVEHLERFCQDEYEKAAANNVAVEPTMMTMVRTGSKASEAAGGGDGLRCWIWVHHITDKDRRKSIIEEANCRHLSGFLKSGYPGVILIEGRSDDCQSFVTWVKGNKSRPGGFGRNWGHHCRGQIVLGSQKDWRLSRQVPSPDSDIQRVSTFTELDDLAILAEECRMSGLEDEFLTYVMQHR